MSLSVTSLVGPALGMMPHLGPYLSAACVDVAQSAQNAKILKDLDALSADLSSIEQEMNKLDKQAKLYQLYKAMKNAPSKISSWYEGTAKNWLQEQTQDPTKKPLKTGKGDLGEGIATHCYRYLTYEINTAMNGSLQMAPGEGGGDWIKELIAYYMADTNQDATPISVLEKTYRAYLWMAQIQIKGLLCLRAIGTSPNDLANYTYQLIDNLIAQGEHCQKVVNDILADNNKENQFAWIQQTNVSPSPSRNVDSTSGIDFLLGSGDFASAVAGVQFGTNRNNNVTGVGVQVAMAEIDGYGGLTNVEWCSVNDDQPIAAYGTSQICVPKIPEEYLVAGDGQIISGAELLYNQTNGNSEFLCLGANVSKLNDYGGLQPEGKIRQEITASTIFKTDNHFIATNQFTNTSTGVPNVDSPITGLYLSCAANQIIISVQTSIHQNAFKAYSVKSTPCVALKSMSTGKYILGNGQNKALSMGDGIDTIAEQKFSIANVNGPTVKYGDFVTLISGASYLTAQLENDGGQLLCLEGGNGGGGASWWQLLDPNDISKEGVEITNWSAVAIKNKQHNTYLLARDSNATVEYPGNDLNGTRVVNPNLVWNLALRQ